MFLNSDMLPESCSSSATLTFSSASLLGFLTFLSVLLLPPDGSVLELETGPTQTSKLKILQKNLPCFKTMKIIDVIQNRDEETHKAKCLSYYGPLVPGPAESGFIALVQSTWQVYCGTVDAESTKSPALKATWKCRISGPWDSLPGAIGKFHGKPALPFLKACLTSDVSYQAFCAQQINIFQLH